MDSSRIFFRTLLFFGRQWANELTLEEPSRQVWAAISSVIRLGSRFNRTWRVLVDDTLSDTDSASLTFRFLWTHDSSNETFRWVCPVRSLSGADSVHLTIALRTYFYSVFSAVQVYLDAGDEILVRLISVSLRSMPSWTLEPRVVFVFSYSQICLLELAWYGN